MSVETRLKISVMTPCYNEEGNVELLYEKVRDVFSDLKKYDYEHIFVDNASTDNTVSILKKIAARDKNLKIIVNSRNFGHIRSPFYGLLQGSGTAVIYLVSDFQDPPEMIKDFILKWEEGYKIVVGVKKQSKESKFMFGIRKIFYNFIGSISEINLLKNFTGFGLYDKKVIEILRQINDPYPYFRGLICEIGLEMFTVEYTQPARRKGASKNNFYSLYDMAMLGITNHSKLPLRLAAILGFITAFISLLFAVIYFIYKLVFWSNFSVGTAPIVIGLFFFSAVQLFFIGIIGEYIGSIHTQILKRPLVIEKERINF
ncbi:MAG: glycosyltransferase family 2 protein [Candidatus Omnitrophica bacterium]|nr:glycosyltransferase family 2 protein [Candidatus Omnitrophota bacterium]